MSVDRILMLKLLGDTSSIDKSLKKSQGRIRGFASSAGSWMKAAGIGLAIEGVSKLGETLGDAWDGFREGEKAAGQLGTTWKNLGLDGSELQGVIDDISASTIKLGTDDTEAIKAYNTALQNTGGNSAAAMRRLKIAQDLVANGSAPNLQSALKLIDRAGSGSAATVRKFGLTADTAKGRIKQLGDRVKGAAEKAAAMDPVGVMFNAMNEDLEGVVGSLASGDLEGALQSVADIGKHASEAWTAVFPAVDKAMTGLLGEETWNNVKETAQGALDAISTIVGKLGLIWDGLAPHISTALALVEPLIANVGVWVETAVGVVTGALDAVIALLNGDFSGAWTAITGIVDTVKVGIETAIGNVLTFLQGILPGISEAAVGIGNAIFGGIIGVIGGIVDTLRTIFVNAVNAIIGAWNNLNFEIPAFELPAVDIGFPSTGNGDLDKLLPRIQGGPWPIWEGTGDLIPNFDPIALAKGGVIRKRPGGMLARIGEGKHDEAVIPLDRAGIGGNTIYLTVNVPPTANLADVGREITRALKAFGQGGGQASMRAAIGVR